MEYGVHIISKREGEKVRDKFLKTFLFKMCSIFRGQSKNDKCFLFFVGGYMIRY